MPKIPKTEWDFKASDWGALVSWAVTGLLIAPNLQPIHISSKAHFSSVVKLWHWYLLAQIWLDGIKYFSIMTVLEQRWRTRYQNSQRRGPPLTNSSTMRNKWRAIHHTTIKQGPYFCFFTWLWRFSRLVLISRETIFFSTKFGLKCHNEERMTSNFSCCLDDHLN
jgi:hypothetical protein